MKKLLFLLLFPVFVNAQSFLQIGPSLNYGFTNLKTSQVGSGANFTYLYSVNPILSVYGDFQISLHGGKTLNLNEYSYGAWNSKLSVGVDISIYYTDESTPAYFIMGGGYNQTNTIFINQASAKGFDTKYNYSCPALDLGLGSKIPWGRYNSIVFELKYTQLFGDYFDGVKEIGYYHNDSYLTFTFKTELPL
jgi:hypothetical protein